MIILCPKLWSTYHQINNDDVQQEVNIDELLITYVARKRTLFDYRIPANKRKKF